MNTTPTISGRSNGYGIDVTREYKGERKTKVCGWPGCDTLIRPLSTYCASHAQITRRMEHDERVARNIHPRHLQPIPDGMELIYYPYMAQSERGEHQVREQVRRRLRRYFARQKPKPPARVIHPLVRAAWKELSR